MSYKYYLFLILSLLSMVACEETITLDTQQVEPVVVIEALITNQERKQYVRVTRTRDFYSENESMPVTDAKIVVRDGAGNRYAYSYAPNQAEGTAGYYFSKEVFAGIDGREYTMTVKIGDQTFTATDQMQPVGKIDSLGYHINIKEFKEPDKPGYYHEVRLYAQEPQDRKDYYLFKFYRNDSIILNMRNDIYIVDDEFLGEMIDGVPLPGFFKKGDTARVEMFSLSRPSYYYFSDLLTLLTSDGGMFSPPPANPRNNWSDGALGQLQASEVSTSSVVIK